MEFMMKFLNILFLLVATPKLSFSENLETPQITTLRCHFTEPFFDTVFITHKDGIEQKQGPLTIEVYIDQIFKSVGVIMDKEISKEGFEELTFTLLNSDNVRLRVRKNNLGSDGMSEIVYPYGAIYTDGVFVFYGGCNSEISNPLEYIPMS